MLSRKINTLDEAIEEIEKDSQGRNLLVKTRLKKELRDMQRKLHSTIRNIEGAAKQKLESIQGGVKMTRKAARNVDRYTHKKPWIVVSAISCAALITGFLFGFTRR